MFPITEISMRYCGIHIHINDTAILDLMTHIYPYTSQITISDIASQEAVEITDKQLSTPTEKNSQQTKNDRLIGCPLDKTNIFWIALTIICEHQCLYKL